MRHLGLFSSNPRSLRLTWRTAVLLITFSLFSSRVAKVSFLFKTKTNWICSIVHDSCIVSQPLKCISFICVALFKTELQSAKQNIPKNRKYKTFDVVYLLKQNKYIFCHSWLHRQWAKHSTTEMFGSNMLAPSTVKKQKKKNPKTSKNKNWIAWNYFQSLADYWKSHSVKFTNIFRHAVSATWAEKLQESSRTRATCGK